MGNDRLRIWRQNHLKKHGVTSLWFVSLRGNLNSILRLGILPKNEIERRNIPYQSFAEETVQERRHHHFPVELSNKQSHHIHDLAPLYFCPRTPTLYSRRERQPHMVFFEVSAELIADPRIQFAFSDGNAAHGDTTFYRNLKDLDKLPWKILQAERWTDFPDGKRQRNAEFLVYPSVAPEHFVSLGVFDESARSRAAAIVAASRRRIPVSTQPGWYF